MNRVTMQAPPKFVQSPRIQINLNIMDLHKLRDAMDHPENPEYQNAIIQVTGYAARFISLSKIYQKEFVDRMNYEGL